MTEISFDKFLFLNDENISFGAKGTLFFLMQRMCNCVPFIDEMSSYCTDSPSTISKYFKELIENGYMFSYRERNDDGSFGVSKIYFSFCKNEVAEFKEHSGNL